MNIFGLKPFSNNEKSANKERFVPPLLANAEPVERMRAKLVTYFSLVVLTLIVVMGSTNYFILNRRWEVAFIFSLSFCLMVLPLYLLWVRGRLLAATVSLLTCMTFALSLSLFFTHSIIFPGYVWFVTLGAISILLLGAKRARFAMVGIALSQISVIIWNCQYGFSMINEMRVETMAARTIFGLMVSMLALYKTMSAYDQLRADAEDEIKRNMKELQLAKSQGQLGIVASGMAHEINNPLTMITGAAWKMARMVQKGNPDPHEMVKTVEILSRRSEAIAAMLRELLHFAMATDAGKMSDGSLRNTVNQAIANKTVLATDAKVTFTVSCPNDKPLMFDRERLRLAIEHVIDNAIKATAEKSPGGTINIKVEWLQDTVEIWVIDQGPGIPEAIREAIFTPFYTTRAPGQGRGLGMSAVYHVVQAHSGVIRFQDLNDKQHAVIIALPRQNDAAREAELPLAS